MPNHPNLLKLLFATFPPQTGDLAAMMEAYDIALDAHDPRDVETAVRRFIRGEVPGHNASFAPSASKLGEAVRAAMNERLDHEQRRKKPALPPPDLEKDEASRARVAALVAEVTGKLRTEEADGTARHRAVIAKANAFYDAERGFTVGDKEDHEAAA